MTITCSITCHYIEPIPITCKNNILEIRTILFCPTGNSEANPIYTSLKSLDFSNDVILNYSDTKLIEKLNEIEKDKQDIED